MNQIKVTGFSWAPPFAQGLVRDLRVRWALQEAALPYTINIIDLDDRHSAAYREKHPFGMVPVFEVDGQALFESGAILHQIAESSEALMPREEAKRADTIVWMYAALNTVEPSVNSLSVMDLVHADEEWVKLARPVTEALVRKRLAALAEWLEGREHLIGRFTVADILMTTVLRLIRHTELVAELPVLEAYVRRCQARPAFQKALEEQLAGYKMHQSVPA